MTNPQVAEQIMRLKDQDAIVRCDAINRLANIGDASAVSALIEVLKDENSVMRDGAAIALENTGVSAIPALMQALKDKNRYVRSSACNALGKIGDASVLPVLMGALNDEDAWVCIRATVAL